MFSYGLRTFFRGVVLCGVALILFSVFETYQIDIFLSRRAAVPGPSHKNAEWH